MKKLAIAFLLLTTACQNPPAKQNGNAYPDLNSFFQQEISRLNAKKPELLKEVILDGQPEQQKLRQLNWEQELALFTASDINKAAYRGLYRVEKRGLEEVYTASAAQLKTRTLNISREQNGKIKSIRISNRQKNSLYSSEEYLEYYPDSLYRIKKKQDVVVLGSHTYQITGKLSR